MDFDPLVMFVVITPIIQLMAVGMMGVVMYINHYFDLKEVIKASSCRQKWWSNLNPLNSCESSHF